MGIADAMSASSLVLANRDYADSGAAQSRQSDPSWSDSRTAGALRSAGSSMSSYGKQEAQDVQRDIAGMNRSTMPSFKKGGMVRKTGPARLHKGEMVVPRNKVKRVKKAMRKKSRD